ncbi:ABC transporter permease [Neomegalonema sp.]|uniref:ABC transporter permease n=1 Tax=Neomegalonema sp. TaxID=2039713 RepID=UPI00261E2BB5|nr:ABC transporter permease [Neomegalonema sp.]MDD2868006.1 ABC transporter permease [Neomegalonema sp.]
MALFDLSPINQRRWSNFKANRRAIWSLRLFLAIFVVSLFAEVIANDKPLLVKYEGGYYTPILKFYPETAFGGDFETEADYHDEFLANLIREGDGWMIWPLIPYSYDTISYGVGRAPAPPSAQHVLGVDDQARDVTARLIYGFRISVLFGLTLAIFSSVVGIMAGAVQGYFGGWLDLVFQRVIEIWSSTPQLYLIMIVSAIIVPSFWMLLGLMLLFSWTSLVGVVRAEFLRARNFEYVRAAQALGVSNATIMRRHLLPNAMVATVTMAPFVVTSSIATLTSLDFLGFGLPPGSPSLGEMTLQGQNNLQAPWLGFTAFFAMAIMMSLLVFIFEGVRDAFDPRKTFV